MSTLIIFLLLICTIHNAAGACTFPSDLRGTWVSSDRGSLTFNSSHVVDYPVYNQGNLAFSCDSLAGSYYILLSEEFTLFSSPAIAVMCITFTSLKESLYKYQIHTSMLQDADYQRIRFAATGTTVDSSLACTDLGSTDYYLLMADGQISAVKEQCPDVFLGTFGFSFNASDCANNTGSLDVCTDLNTMSFNYSDCSTNQAYSSGGSLNCVYSTTSGDVTTLNVYNLDSTTDESTTYRFTCYIIEQTSGSSDVYATQYPKDCHINQTSTYVPGPGANLTMLASVTCVPTTTTTDEAAVSQASLIAGLAAGFIVLLLLALLIVCFYCHKKKSKIQPAGKAPIDTDPGDLHPDTTWAEIPESTTEPVEIEQDALAILHDTELNVIDMNKQRKQTTDASISLKKNKDGNSELLKRSDRQSSVRFTVSNLKKKQVNKKTKTESKPKPSSKPNVPKKKLPWPALFLPQDNDTRKDKERERKEKLSIESSKLTQEMVSRETSIAISEEIVEETEQINPPDIDDEREKECNENANMSAESIKNTQEQPTIIECEMVSPESAIGIAEEIVNETDQINPTDFPKHETTKKQTEIFENDLKEKQLEDDKNALSESQDNTQELTLLEYETTNVMKVCKNEVIIEKDETPVDQNITEQENRSVFKTLNTEESEPITPDVVTETKEDILDENNTATDLTRNESAIDSGVYSNSSSAEPNIDIEAVDQADDVQIKTIVHTMEIDKTDLTPNQDELKKDEDSEVEPTEKSSIMNRVDQSDDHNDTQSVSIQKSSVCGQSDDNKKDPIINEIDQERNVYVDMLKDILASDSSNSKTPRMEPVPINPNNVADDIQKDDIATARHVMLTQKAEITTEEEIGLSKYGERVIEKQMDLEREQTHYSIERNPLPSIGKQVYIEKSDKKERIRQIKDKRVHDRKLRKENPPTEIRSKNIIEPITTVPSDEKLVSQLSTSDIHAGDTLPKLVRAPHKDHEDTKDNQLPVMEQTLTNHERKSELKPKKKKRSFLPTITNASMFADEFVNTDAETTSCEKDSSDILNNLVQYEEPNQAEEPINLETLQALQPNKEIIDKKTEVEAPPIFKLPDSANITKPTKTKRVNHKPKGLSLPNLMGKQRHSAPEFRLPMLSSDNKEASRRPDSFKDTTTHTLTVPIPENRALVQGSSDAAWVEKESSSKSKKGRKDNKAEKATGKQKEKQKSKTESKVGEKPKRKRKRKKNVAAVEEDDDVDTTKYFNDKERAGKVRPGDKDDIQGLILRIRENTMDFGFQNNHANESSEDE